MGDVEHDVPIHHLIVVHRDVPKAYGRLHLPGECVIDQSHPRQRVESLAHRLRSGLVRIGDQDACDVHA